MNRKKRLSIEERLALLEKHLANAQEYVAQDVNVQGTPWRYRTDWQGQSGHPASVQNHMIPTLKRCRAKWQRGLDSIWKKRRDRRVTMHAHRHGMPR